MYIGLVSSSRSIYATTPNNATRYFAFGSCVVPLSLRMFSHAKIENYA
ncbi:MAG: hypothetical protein VB124_03265 [Burkholderia sp.]